MSLEDPPHPIPESSQCVARRQNLHGWFWPQITLVVNDRGTLGLPSSSNVDDANPARTAQGLTGKRVGDRGFISRRLFQILWDRGFVTKIHANKLLPIVDKLLLPKRSY
ncbi:MAG: hypothetical protein IPM75_14220 [Candidatus Competibacteraceae bacterium]|nr:hypothetical protein [Candidatus Competibacteraceae bacterium]